MFWDYLRVRVQHRIWIRFNFRSIIFFLILLETTPNLDNAVEHLAAASRCSLFALNRRCAELRIMDIKLRYNLFNTLVHSIASYVCEVWVDSKNIEAIEVVYRGFLKSLLRVRKTTSTSIVLT
jgi:hypothetical protein